jgi:hypothetical protein
VETGRADAGAGAGFGRSGRKVNNGLFYQPENRFAVVVQSDLCSSSQLRAAPKPKANASSSVWNDFSNLFNC